MGIQMKKIKKHKGMFNFWTICTDLRLFDGKIILVLSLLTLLMTLFEGLGVALLLPVLEVLGTGGSYDNMGASSKFWSLVVAFFDFFGIEAQINPILLLIFIAALSKQLVEALLTFVIAKMQFSTVAGLRFLFLQRVLSANKHFIEEMTTGKFLDTAMNLSNATGAFLNIQFKQMSNYLTIFMYLCALLFVAPKTTLFLLCYGALLGFVVRGFNRRISELSIKNIAFNKNATESLITYFNCWRALKFSDLAKFHQKKFDDLLQTWARTSENIVMQGVYSRLVTNPVSTFVICIILFFSLRNQSLQIVDITLFCIAFIRITPMYKSVISSRQSIFALKEKIKSFHAEFFDSIREAEIDNGTKTLSSRLKEINIKNLTFSYSGNEPFLFDKFNDKIPCGKITAIIGASGSGKTTFVDLLTRLIRPPSQAFSIDRTCITEFQLSDFRDSFYYMSQNMPVFGDSIRDYLSSSHKSVLESDIVHSLRLAELHEFIDDQGSLTHTPLQEDGSNLSGGQKQRLNLARAFLSASQFIVLDEPTSNLDSERSKRVFQNIKKFSLENNTTIIIISHDVISRNYVDHIINLNEN
jgi:ATP-binding cassette, subfamily B, bacterial PglK